MVSRNNKIVRSKQVLSYKCRRFSLRKLSIGVVSVLIGVSFYGVASADTDVVSNSTQPVVETNADTNNVSLNVLLNSNSSASQTLNVASDGNQSSNINLRAEKVQSNAPVNANVVTISESDASTHNVPAQSINLNDSFKHNFTKTIDEQTSVQYAKDFETNFANNTYRSDPVAKGEQVDYKNLSNDQLLRLNQYQLSLVNSVRQQMGLSDYVTSQEMINWEQKQAQAQADNHQWGHNGDYLHGAGENVAAALINNEIGVPYDQLKPSDFHFSRSSADTISYTMPIVSVKTMDDLQAMVFYNVTSMLFYDSGKEANGHAHNFLDWNKYANTMTASGFGWYHQDADKSKGQVAGDYLFDRFIIPNTDTFVYAGVSNPKIVKADPEQGVAKQVIHFVDDTDNSLKVNDLVITNPKGTKLNLTLALPHGYDLTGSQSLPISFDFSNGDLPDLTIHLVHHLTPITDNRTKASFKQTIHYKFGNVMIAPDTVITADFQRSISKDDVTGKITAGKWRFVKGSLKQIGMHIAGLNDPGDEYNSVAGFDSFNFWIPFSVKVDNYHQGYSGLTMSWSLSNTPGYVGGSGSEYTVNYDKDDHKVTYQFKDESGKVVGTQVVTGPWGTDKDVTLTVPNGYTLKNSNDSKQIAKIDKIDITVPINVVSNNHTITYRLVDSDGQVIGSQSVTGRVGTSRNVKLNVPDNYVVDNNVGYTVVAEFGSADSVVKVSVHSVTLKLVYWDDTENKVFKSFDIKFVGELGTSVGYDPYLNGFNDSRDYISVGIDGVPDGDEFLGNYHVPFSNSSCDWKVPNFDFTKNGLRSINGKTFTVHLKHRTQLNVETQTRTITLHYVYGAGDKQGQPVFDDAVLDVYYHRTATLDRVTNQTTYGDWLWDQSQGDPSTPGYHVVSGKWTNLPQTWANVTADVPSIKGYYADLGQNDPTNTNHVPANKWVHPAWNDAGSTGDTLAGHESKAYQTSVHVYEAQPDHTVKYMPIQTTVTVNYVDDDNNKAVVGSQHWNGTTGQHIDLTLTPPDNYVLTPGWVNPTSYDFDGVNSTWYTVHVKHKTQDVTNQEPKDQVTKVTRLTRNHLYGDGPHKGEKFAEPDIFDLAWKRTATKDLVTNKVTFGNWQVNWDDSKSVQGRLTARPVPYSSVDGMLYAGKNGYSCLGDNAHSEFVRADGSVKVNRCDKYGWQGVAELEVYPVLNYYYGPGQVNIPVVYVDADTGQKVAEKINNEALTGNDFRDGNTVAIDQSKLTNLPTTLTGYQLLPGQTMSTSYKIDTFAGIKAIEVQVVKDRSVKVTFVDDDNKGAVVRTPTIITGHTGGDPVALDLTVPDKYELADGQQLPTSYTFAKGSGDLTIHLVHKIAQREAIIDVRLGLLIKVHIDNNSDDIDVIPKTKWTPQLADEPKTADIDDLEYKLRLSSSVEAVEAGTLTGHVNYDLVDEKVVSFGDDWTTLNLNGQTYQMPNGTDVVNGVIPDYNNYTSENFRECILKSYPILDPDYANRAWHGYLSVNATNNNDLIDGVHQLGLQAGLAGDEPNVLAKATGDRAAISVEMGNKTIDLSFLQSIINPETVDFSEQNGQLRADEFLPVGGVYIPYVEKTATRTIEITMPDGKTTTVKQTVTLAKQVVLEYDAHQNWTAGEWTRYDVPTIPGYTASQPNVAQQTVTGETEDQTVNITYTANPQTTTVVYQTEDGTPVHTTTVDGKTGQTVKVPNEVPAGWHIVNGKVPSELTFGPDGAPKTVVTIDHSHVTVTSDTPKTPADKLPDNPDKAYPAGVSENDLNKTVIRTIKVITPDGQTKTVAQTVKLTRTADVDEVTGDVEYSNWTTGEWLSYEVPAVPGYTPSQSEVSTAKVTDDTKDQTITVTYMADYQTLIINYVDNSGKVIKTSQVTGNNLPGSIVNVTYEVPDHYVIESDMVKTFMLNDNPDDNVLSVIVVPKLDLRSFESGDADLNKSVTRTINIKRPDGKVRTVVQTVKLGRNAYVNEVTGQTSYTSWIVNGPAVFTSYVPEVINGYVGQVVKAEKVDINSKDEVVTIGYTSVEKAVSYPYIDVNGKTFDSIPTGYHVIAGQVPSKGAMLIVKDEQPIVVKPIEFVTRTVIIAMPNGRTRTIRQRVRKGTMFGRVAVPRLHGYKIQSNGNIGRMKATNDMIVVVSFVK